MGKGSINAEKRDPEDVCSDLSTSSYHKRLCRTQQDNEYIIFNKYIIPLLIFAFLAVSWIYGHLYTSYKVDMEHKKLEYHNKTEEKLSRFNSTLIYCEGALAELDARNIIALKELEAANEVYSSLLEEHDNLLGEHDNLLGEHGELNSTLIYCEGALAELDAGNIIALNELEAANEVHSSLLKEHNKLLGEHNELMRKCSTTDGRNENLVMENERLQDALNFGIELFNFYFRVFLTILWLIPFLMIVRYCYKEAYAELRRTDVGDQNEYVVVRKDIWQNQDHVEKGKFYLIEKTKWYRSILVNLDEMEIPLSQRGQSLAPFVSERCIVRDERETCQDLEGGNSFGS